MLSSHSQDPTSLVTQGLVHGGPDGISPPREHPATQGPSDSMQTPKPGAELPAQLFLSAFPIYHQPKAFILSPGPQPLQSETVTN